MANNLPPDDMQKAWQDQEIEATQISLEEIRRDIGRFNRRMRLNNLSTYFGYAALVAFFIWQIWHPRRAAAEAPTLARVSMALVLMGMSYTIYQYRKRVSAMPISTEALEDCLNFHRRQLTRQRDYFRTGWWWGVAPIIPGFAVGFIGLVISLPNRRSFTAFSAFVFLLFLYRAWKGMRRRADRLQHKLVTLDRKEKQT